MEYVAYNDYIYTHNDIYFQKYYLHQQFCDCTGELFEVVGKTPPKSWWRRTFRFLPNVYREKLIHKSVGHMDLERLRAFLHKQVSGMAQSDFDQEWLNHINKAQTHRELIDGMVN